MRHWSTALGFAGLLVAALLWARRGSEPAPQGIPALHRALVDARVEDCARHGDGPREFNEARLTETARRLAREIPVVLGALGLSFMGIGSFRRRELRSGTASVRRREGLPELLLAGVIASGLVLVEQGVLLARAASEGLFGESDADREARFFGDEVVRAAAEIRARVPADARVLIVRTGVPRELNRLQYLLFPRRIFMPPRSDIQLDAERLRQLLAEHPESIRPYLEAGYTHALDLARVLTGDPAGIVDLRRTP